MSVNYYNYLLSSLSYRIRTVGGKCHIIKTGWFDNQLLSGRGDTLMKERETKSINWAIALSWQGR